MTSNRPERRFLQNKHTKNVFMYTPTLALNSDMMEVSDIEARKSGFPVDKDVWPKEVLSRHNAGNPKEGIVVETLTLRGKQ